MSRFSTVAGKKAKGKGKVMSLAEFQGTGGVPEGFKKNVGANWADLMESGNGQLSLLFSCV